MPVVNITFSREQDAMNLLTGKAHRSKARNAVYSLLAWVQIILQVVLPLFSFASVSARADDQPRTHADTLPSAPAVSATAPDALPASATLSTVATSLSSSGAAGLTGSARTAAAGYAASSAQTWLNQFGTARIQLNVDENGNWDDSAFDFLAPLYDNKKSLLFTQLGLRAPDGRTTGNIGMGVRTSLWMMTLRVKIAASALVQKPGPIILNSRQIPIWVPRRGISRATSPIIMRNPLMVMIFAPKVISPRGRNWAGN